MIPGTDSVHISQLSKLSPSLFKDIFLFFYWSVDFGFDGETFLSGGGKGGGEEGELEHFSLEIRV